MLVLLINFRRFDDQKAFVRLPAGFAVTLSFVRVVLMMVGAHTEWKINVNGQPAVKGDRDKQ